VDDDLKVRLEQAPGAWQLLETPSELLVALRDHGGTLFTELSEVHQGAVASSPPAPGSAPPANRAVLAGDLAEMQPSDLLNFLHQGRRTGVLLTRASGVERGLVILEGNVAWACSTCPGERLGELLSRAGHADRARVQAVLTEQGAATPHRRLGQLLVDRGVLSQEALSRGLRHQVMEIFLGLLVAKAGSFVFLRGVDRAALPSTLALDMQGLLLDGLRRLDEMEVFRTLVPSPDVVPRPTGKAASEELGADERRLLALADGSRSLADLSQTTALGEYEAARAAYALIERGYLRL